MLASGLALVIGALAWLSFGLAGSRAGLRTFPDGAGSHLESLPDHGSRLTFAEVATQPDAAWQRWDGRDYLRALQGDVVWLRVSLRNPGAEPLHAVLADSGYFPDLIAAWTQDRDGQWQRQQTGEALPAPAKPLWGRLGALPVTVPAGGGRVVYLRASDYYNVYLRPVWWPRAEDYFATQMRNVLAEGLCYGALVALLLYNVVLWVRLRFPDTGYYVLYAGGMAAFNFVSNGGLALLGLPAGSPGKEMMVVGLLALSGFFLVQFARTFIGTAALFPRTDRWLRGLQALIFVLGAGGVTMPWMSGLGWLGATFVTLSLTHALLLVLGLAAWRAGAVHARFFVAAFGLLFAGVVPAVVTWLNGDILAGAAMGLLASSTLEMVMLSFAVADRFAQTQRQLAEETEQRRVMEAAYADELRLEVQERTRELEQANTDKDRMLTVIGHDLRSPLTGLMRAADETTGEFARETSRTGRALLLMIEDLVLWARLHAGTRENVALAAEALTGPAVALHRTLAEHDGIALVVAVPAALRVRTDLVLAQTLVRNLLANALKFARTQVVLRAEAAGGGVRFTVGNDGLPLEPGLAARFAAGEDGPMTATGGLGLRLCREICHALGTKLAAGTAADGGTEFYFTLKPGADAEIPSL